MYSYHSTAEPHDPVSTNGRRGQVSLSIIIVNINTMDLLEKCLTSIRQNTHEIAWEIFVVDNASRDGSAEMIRASFPQVVLIENETNKGFSTGNNQAIVRSRGRYILLLNPDTVVLHKSLDRMVAFLDTHPSAGAVGAKLLNYDGSFQMCCSQHIPTLGTELFEVTLRWFFGRSWGIGRRINGFWEHNDARAAAQVSGACLMIRREALEDVGLLDEGFFVFWEDFDWCFRAHKKGWDIYCLPEAELIHYRGQYAQRPDVEVEAAVEFEKSRTRFIRKHYGQRAYYLLKIGNILASTVKMTGWTLLYLLRVHEREAISRRILAHKKVMRQICRLT